MADDIEDAISAALGNEHVVLDYGRLLKAWNLDSRQKPGRLLRGIARVDTADGPLWLAKSRWSDLLQTIVDTLGKFHRGHPEQPGMEQGLLARTALAPADRRLFSPAVAALETSGAVRLLNGLVAASDFTATRPGEDDADWIAVADCLEQHGVQVPGLTQLRTECGTNGAGVQRRTRRCPKRRSPRQGGQ